MISRRDWLAKVVINNFDTMHLDSRKTEISTQEITNSPLKKKILDNFCPLWHFRYESNQMSWT